MTHQAVVADVWTTGESYEPYTGRWSRLVARDFLTWLGAPRAKEWLDAGCGTGALTQAILDLAKPKSVLGVDPSAAFVEYAKSHVTIPKVSFQLAIKTTMSFRVGDASALPIDDNSFDVAVAGLALNFIAEPERAVAELARVVRRRGAVAAYVWDYAGKMELMRTFWDAAVALDPAALELDEARRFPMCKPAALTQLFSGAGLEDVHVKPIDVSTHFQDFDDYWTPFLGGQGPGPAYVASLDRERRNELRDAIRDDLPVRRDGSIRLAARAWAVKGRTT
jgi:SAM-dependent methyltransferase